MEAKVTNGFRAFMVVTGLIFIFSLYGTSAYSWKIEKTTKSVEKRSKQNLQYAQPTPKSKLSPQQLDETKRQLLQELYKPKLDYTLFTKLPDPFVPFVKPATEEAMEHATLEELLPPEPVILTPLQKMDISEIERGFKGTLWGPHGRKAIIEDSTGKGYIVDIGTRIGTHDGVVTAILKDRLVIRQKIWNRKKRNFVFEEVVVKLRKGT